MNEPHDLHPSHRRLSLSISSLFIDNSNTQKSPKWCAVTARLVGHLGQQNIMTFQSSVSSLRHWDKKKNHTKPTLGRHACLLGEGLFQPAQITDQSPKGQNEERKP